MESFVAARAVSKAVLTCRDQLVTINGIICHINSSGFIIEKKQKWVLSLD
jgi:hypothetical protein